jgi:all-trans-retinol 13,14-reductase
MNTDSLHRSDTAASATAQSSGGVTAKLGFVAWVAYGILSGRGWWLSAGLVGTTLMLLIVATQLRHRAVKLMDCTSLGYFVGETLMVLASGHAFIQRYHLALVWGVFAAVAWFTVLAGCPFTAQYTREQMPCEVWDNPDFYRMNRRMTEVWSVIFTLGMVLGEISMLYGHTLLLGMIIPMAAMGLGFVFSLRYPRWFARRFAPAGTVEQRPNSQAEPTGESSLTPGRYEPYT